MAGGLGAQRVQGRAVIFASLLALALLFPLLTDLSATKMAVKDKFLPPAFMAGGRWDHLLGTDQLGRDLFLRSLIGLQNALLIGIATVVLMFVVGCGVGLIAGYRGGWIDTSSCASPTRSFRSR